MPPLLEPTLRKQEVEGLKRDIPRYYGHMTSSAEAKWKAVIEDPNSLLLNPVSSTWPIDNLVSAQRTAAGDPLLNVVPLEVERMREREKTPLNEVALPLTEVALLCLKLLYLVLF